jgi:hypothetical protein
VRRNGVKKAFSHAHFRSYVFKQRANAQRREKD